MKRLVLLLFLLAASPALFGQGYDVPEVTISTEKANIAGKRYYLHKVLPKQTVFSICKAYGVTEEALSAANPDLKKEGLKAGAILFVPMTDEAMKAEAAAQAEASRQTSDVKQDVKQEDVKEAPDEGETVEENEDGPQIERVIEHQVRWFESVGSIARKYKISVAELLAYNGLTESDSVRGKTLLIPVMKREASAESAEEEKPQEVREPEETTVDQPEEPMPPVRKVRWYTADEPINIALILPFNATGNASASFLNFYSGALMAVQEQKEKGAHVILNVYDLAQGTNAILDDPKFLKSDLIVGPVEASTLAPFLDFSDQHGVILVSPLDHKVDSLVDTHPFLFQAPASANTQLNNLIGSLHGRYAGPVILVTSTATGEEALVSRIEEALHENGISYRKTHLPELASQVSTGSHIDPARVIIGSENRAFTAEVISALNTLSKKNVPMQVWCTNRVRNYETSDPDALFNLSVHTSVPYFVDYSNPDDQRFVRQYRALYHAEPEDFAFQGHDVMAYFISRMMQQGSAFSEHADLYPMQLLHCNFHFVRGDDEKSGWRNRATRNLVYDKEDFSIVISK